jgi:hypothetical protein
MVKKPKLVPPSAELLAEVPWGGEGPDPRAGAAAPTGENQAGDTLWTSAKRHHKEPGVGRFDTEVIDPVAVPFGGLLLPSRFRIVPVKDGRGVPSDLPRLTVEVRDGQPRCVLIEARDGAELRGETLRKIPVGLLIRAASWELALPVGPRKRIAPAVEWVGRASGDEVDAELHLRGPGVRVTDERLRRVAEIYQRAQQELRSPTDAVSKEMPCARSTAGRWVMQARGRTDPTTGEKFLGPAPKARQAGERKGQQ